VTVRRDVRALGVNHVALEVDSVDAASERWSRLLDVEVRGQRPGMAWIDSATRSSRSASRASAQLDAHLLRRMGVTTIAKSIDAAIDACVSRRDPVEREYGITSTDAMDARATCTGVRGDH
jgi:hypothetical protein